MNPIAEELNQILVKENPHIMKMQSTIGRDLFFPKGILTQSAEAKQKAHKFNASAGIAKESYHTMYLDSVMTSIKGIRPSESLTYAPSYGIPDLREVWQKSLYQKNSSLSGKTISLPVVTSGITHGISTFADMWIDPGDVVILPDMMWGNYNMILSTRKGARIRHYSIFTNDGGLNLESFEEVVQDEARKNKKITVIINFPHNPSGYTATDEEGDRMVDILTHIAKSGTNVLTVTDDSYFGLFYEHDVLQESLFARFCGRDSRLLAIKLDGCTKENYVWGLRVGFITYGVSAASDTAAVYDALEKKTAGCIRGTISNASHLGQTIVLKSMQDEKYSVEKKDKFETMQKRALRVKAVLSDAKYQDAWDVYPFNSGYFMCLRLRTVPAEKLRVHLLDKYGVGLIALGDANLRVAFSCLEEEDIQELFEIILQGVRDLE